MKWVRMLWYRDGGGHWVRVSISLEAAMPIPSYLTVLVIVCGAIALPAIQINNASHEDYEHQVLTTNFTDNNRTSKGVNKLINPPLSGGRCGQKNEYTVTEEFICRPSLDAIPTYVLNFFPIPVSVDCISDDGRRTGICLNTYECRMQSGRAHGPCALGFGVCCVFTATCGMEVFNNVTYFVSPSFPTLSRDISDCTLTVKKIDPSISQFRLDFEHFNLGQPNRQTGVCDSDYFMMSGGRSQALKLCGLNSGQHVYYDVDDVNDPITIIMNTTDDNSYRIWEIKISQIEFNQRAPAGCRQYFQGNNGVIQTMNYAINGRHLADQDYTICMRQEEGMCSIAYEPCDENSFKIGPPVSSGPGSGGGPIEDNQECEDKIVMPCDSEEFIMPGDGGGPGVCNLFHCGSSFCTQGETPCRIESSTTPFNIRVQFGPGTKVESPEDNIGMCLRYEQLPCSV